LGRVDADHDQAVIGVSVGPGADIDEGPEPVDAGVGPEVGEHDLPFEIGGRERRRVQPAGRPVEAGQVALDWERAGAAEAVEEAHAPRPPTSRTASANASGASWGRLSPTPPSIVRCEYGPENFAA